MAKKKKPEGPAEIPATPGTPEIRPEKTPEQPVPEIPEEDPDLPEEDPLPEEPPTEIPPPEKK